MESRMRRKSQVRFGERDEETRLSQDGKVRLVPTPREWRVVFVTGVEEGLLPHTRALLDADDETDTLDAERQLAYVAVTRPRERLYLSYCRNRRRGDTTIACQPSRFLHGLPLDVSRSSH